MDKTKRLTKAFSPAEMSKYVPKTGNKAQIPGNSLSREINIKDKKIRIKPTMDEKSKNVLPSAGKD